VGARKGDVVEAYSVGIEHPPVADASVDVILST